MASGEVSNERLIGVIDRIQYGPKSEPLTPNQLWVKAMTESARRNQPMPTSPEALLRWEMTVEADAAQAVHEVGAIGKKSIDEVTSAVDMVNARASRIVNKYSPPDAKILLIHMGQGVHEFVGTLLEGGK